MSNIAANSGLGWQPETIRDLLTADRLRSYLASCGQDLDRALALYEWNLTASSAVMQTTAMVEVIIVGDVRILIVFDAGRVNGLVSL